MHAEEGGEVGSGGEEKGGGGHGGRGGQKGVLEEGIVGGGKEEVEVVVGVDEPGEEGLHHGHTCQQTEAHRRPHCRGLLASTAATTAAVAVVTAGCGGVIAAAAVDGVIIGTKQPYGGR